MYINPRRQKYFNGKFAAYILLLAVGACAFLLNVFFLSKKPLFISPVVKTNINLNSVKKILNDNNILFSQVSLSDDSYLVNIRNNGQVRLSQDKDMTSQISSLQRILRELTIEGKQFKSIDFRFSETIVSF